MRNPNLIFALFTLLQCSIALAAGPDTVDGIIVKYRDETGGVSKAQTVGAELNRKLGLALRYKRQMSGGGHVLSLGKRMRLVDAEHLARLLAADPRVLYAEPDYRAYIQMTPNDTSYNLQWPLRETTGGIRAETAWDKATGTGAVVAVLDTGYRPHADLAANLLPGYDFITEKVIANDGDGRDADAQDPGDWITQLEHDTPEPFGEKCDVRGSTWHGTHVAGTVAAVTNNSAGVAGVAFNARVVPVRVLGKCGGPTSDIVDGMSWAAGIPVPGAPPNANPANVLNLSLGNNETTCPQAYADAIAAVRARGVTIVVAAGNGNVNVIGAPANCAGVISVAATGRTGGKASYSNYHATIDVAAPGGSGGADGVLSTYNTGVTVPVDDALAYVSGTSMAAPHVSGMVALTHSLSRVKRVTLGPDQMEGIIRATARAFPIACTGCGAGIVNARAALDRTEQLVKIIPLPAVLTFLIN